MTELEQIRGLKQEIINHCKHGFSIASFLGKAGLSYKSWNSLCGSHPELQDAVEIAQSEELLYWERTLLNSLEDDPKTANIARAVLNERGDLYEKIYGKNKFTSTPDDMRRRVVTLTQGTRTRDILDDKGVIK